MNMKEQAEQSVREAIQSLRNKPIKSTMLERLHLIEQAMDIVTDLPQPIQLGKGLYHILDHASVPIEPHDLLLGRIPEKLPNEEEEENYLLHFRKVCKKHNFGLLSYNPHGYNLQEIESQPDAPYHLSQFWCQLELYHHGERPCWMNDGGHITFSWEMFLENGIQQLIDKVEAEIKIRKQKGNCNEKIIFLEGMLWVYRGYQRYIIRYGEAAKTSGKNDLADICNHIAYQPPETFYQAVQLMLLLGNAYSVYAGFIAAVTYGRMDDLLLSFYENDIKNNRLTREEAFAIITDFNCKNNLFLGRGEHQMSGDEETDTGWFRNPVYDAGPYVVIGGYSNTYNHRNNPLTKLMVESIVPGLKSPIYVFRYTKDVEDDIWEIVCDKLRKNSTLFVYNDETQIPAMLDAGIKKYDAVNYTKHGCNWPDIPGKQVVIESTKVLLPHMIVKALINEKKQLRRDFKSVDEIYQQISDDFHNSFRKAVQQYCEKVDFFKTAVPTILSSTDCFHDGTIEHANNIYNGAVPYPSMYTIIRSVGTAADMMTALDELVYTQKKYTLEQIVKAINDNFEGHEKLWYACRKASKYGYDNDVADKHAKRLMNTILNIADKITDKEDIFNFNVTQTDMDHIADGKKLMATPDGRLCGMPVSENLSPTPGGGCNSVTALLKSVSKLPFRQIHSGAFNLRARKDWLKGDEGLERLKALLSTYFDMGGMQIQMSVTSSEELRDAQLHPENYRDLVVRVTGYSAVFVDMSKKAQEEFIRRDELS